MSERLDGMAQGPVTLQLPALGAAVTFCAMRLNRVSWRVGWCCLCGWAGLLLLGCEPQLETGYKPHPLNATDADRRAYYAQPFTPEAHPPKDNGSSFEGLGH
jgi:hypothetical protein